MPRRFNVSGPCIPADHYMLPPGRRLPAVRKLVDDKAYFVLHAPRQSGKTTAMRSLARELTAEGRYISAVLSNEVGQPAPHDPGAAEQAILQSWRGTLIAQLPPELRPPPWPEAPAMSRIEWALRAWADAAPRPLALFMDEVDALSDETLVSVLRQFRSGFQDRPGHFPWCIGLVGMRDIRDYLMKAGGSGRTGSASPFNIKDESLTLRNFTCDEVAELYAQHSAETGQAFEPACAERAFELSGGHPWLVNALARQMVEVLVPDRTQPLSRAHADQAAALLVKRRDTHLHSLATRLEEPRVRAIIEPMLTGDLITNVPQTDVEFLLDLGLVRQGAAGDLDVANPIYREIIARELAAAPQRAAATVTPTWLRPDGRLDFAKLLESFLAFWRRHGEVLLKAQPYHEAAPHLVLMAFLQRVENGGRLEREYASGTGRLDLWLRYGPDTLAVEVKVWRPEEPDPLREGLERMDAYLSGLGLDTGWLVIFDRRPGIPRTSERTGASRAHTPGGREVVVVRG